jgi:hypothetical protein
VSILNPARTRCQPISGDRSDNLRELPPTWRGVSHIIAAMYVDGPTTSARREVLHDCLHHGSSASDGRSSRHNRDSPSANGTEDVAAIASVLELSDPPRVRTHSDPAIETERGSVGAHRGVT